MKTQVTIRAVANGYIIETSKYEDRCVSDNTSFTFVAETPESLKKWLDANLEKPSKLAEDAKRR